MTTEILISLAGISLVLWVMLFFFRSGFWLADQRLGAIGELAFWPAIIAVVPARNEVETIKRAVVSLLVQDYPGELRVIVVDDNSNDGTAVAAGESDRLWKISGKPLEEGWSGKLWAVSQGIDAVNEVMPEATYILLTDADIVHDPSGLARLVYKAETEGRHLVSLMVKLRAECFWERWLIPAFVFFFQKLYPFPAVNDPKNKTAAAAGGCMLVNRGTLVDMGGVSVIRSHLIDDCALANLIKSHNPIWIGVAGRTHSLRAYNELSEIWNLVTRTAFVQLNYSVPLMTGTVLGMALIYLIPPIAVIFGLWLQIGYLTVIGGLGWGAILISYTPTLLLYRLSPIRGIALPLVAGLYGLMTIASAFIHLKGEGGYWKGRYYGNVGRANR